MRIKRSKFHAWQQRVSVVWGILLVGGLGCVWASPWPSTRLDRYLEKDDAWYQSEEGRRVLENILSWQDPYGGWPKNLSTADRPYTGDREDLQGTFDNGATTGEMRLLARAYQITNRREYLQAFEKGLDLILKAQYPTGGWPQSYPPGKGYPRYITFNDHAMVRLLYLLRDIAQSPEFDFVEASRRAAAQEAFDRGIECILNCQIRVDDTLTVWCAQHDEVTLQPRPARSYERVSLSGSESAEILRLLMRLKDPSPRVIRAIQAGVRWFEKSKVEGLRIRWIQGQRRAVPDPKAPPMWARFYEIETNRPLFCNRDGIPLYDYNKVDAERREGYAWYGDWGEEVFQEYEEWKQIFMGRLVGEDTAVLLIVGDSTVCDFPEGDRRHGWGEFIQEYLKETMRVVNLARSGRSTRTFLKEGLWEEALRSEPDYVLIQFGHNDSHAPEKPESTDADTEYAENLRRYIEDARAIGAEPILVTPVHRRKFDEAGRLKDTLQPYADAMKRVAAEKNAAVIDLHGISGRLFQQLGEAGCLEIGNEPSDRTHFNEKGARMLARIIMDRLPEVMPDIKTYLKETRTKGQKVE